MPPVTIDWIERAALVGASLLVFAFCLALGTRHHKFPYSYHPDEPGKVEQVITGEFNYHHPMLLLATARLATDLLRTPKQNQAVVEVGRTVSAAFTAGAIVLFALMAYLWRGWRAGLVTAAALAFHHQLYELAHYMKEDSALLFGVAWTFLASLAFAQRPTPWRAAVLGAGCALALSGKYLGVVALGVAVPVLWVYAPSGSRSPAAHWMSFLAAFLIVLVSVNFSLFVTPDIRGGPSPFVTFTQSFHRELDLVVKGQGEVTRRVPHALYWNVFVDNTNPVVWLLLLALLTVCYERWNRLMLPQKILIWFPFLYGFALSFSPKENDRYFLPATAIFTMLAAVGAESLPYFLARLLRGWDNRAAQRLLSRTSRRWLLGCGSAVLLLIQITGWAATKPGWSQYDTAFNRDDIAALVHWMQTDLPPTAIVAADSRVGLPNPDRRKNKGRRPAVPQKLLIKKLACDVGTLDELRAKGVTHVIISETSYGRFFRGDLRPKDRENADFQKGKQFYGELLRNENPIFDRERGTVIYLHPGIRVYALAPAPVD